MNSRPSQDLMAVCEACWQADGKVSGNDFVEAERSLWERWAGDWPAALSARIVAHQ